MTISKANMSEEFEHITVKCLAINQPIGTFYMAVINWFDLKRIARADIRRIEKGEGGAVESYLGIQRGLSKSRVKEISSYVRNVDATFPTAVILHISSYSILNEGMESEREFRNISFNETRSEMTIRVDHEVANILDGQHRIEGLKEGLADGHENKSKFQLNVSIFVDLDMDNQSMVFATVNKAQTKVNRSLVYDLFAFGKTRSPQRTAHLIVRLLNEDRDSAFHNKVKILGTADDPERETITQATIAEGLIKYISLNPMLDRDLLKRNKGIKRVYGSELEKLIFRNLFIDKQDAIIAKIVANLFGAVKEKWPNSWDSSILGKSTGVVAFLKFLRPAYKASVSVIGEEVAKEKFAELLSKVEINEAQFNKEEYLPGSSGQNKLYRELLEACGLES